MPMTLQLRYRAEDMCSLFQLVLRELTDLACDACDNEIDRPLWYTKIDSGRR